MTLYLPRLLMITPLGLMPRLTRASQFRYLQEPLYRLLLFYLFELLKVTEARLRRRNYM